MAGFNDFIIDMANADFFTGILPFLLSYIVFFAVLQKVPLFKNSKNVDQVKFTALTALILSFFTASFIVQNAMFQTFFQGFFGRIAIGMIGLLGLMVFLAMTGIELEGKGVPIIIILVIMGAVGAFGMSSGIYAFLPKGSLPFLNLSLSEIGEYLFDTGLIYFLIAAGALYWATIESDENDITAGEGLLKTLLGTD